MSSQSSIAILGASRGLGLGLAAEFLSRGWRVIATERSPGEGLAALARRHHHALEIESLDINDAGAARQLGDKLAGARKLDILFVNAGVLDDRRPIGSVPPEAFTRLMLTNAFSPLQMIEILSGCVRPDGVIGAMSSGLGSVTDNTGGGNEAYRASKAALNTLMRSYAARDPKRAVVVLSPGWVRTDTGGADEDLDVETSARGLADVLTGRIGNPGSAFLSYAGHPINW